MPNCQCIMHMCVCVHMFLQEWVELCLFFESNVPECVYVQSIAMSMNRTYRNFLLGDESINVANGKVRYEGIEIARELCLKNRN